MDDNLLFIVLFPLLMFVEMIILEKLVPPYNKGVRVGHREIVIFALVDILLIMLITFLVEAF